MKELKSGLITQKYTKVYHEEDFRYNAPHHFLVFKADVDPNTKGRSPKGIAAGDCVGAVNFQEGPIKECGVNGVCNEDLIAMVICRLEGFQNSEFKCRENAMAIIKLEERLMWLRKRTQDREARGVEGTHTV